MVLLLRPRFQGGVPMRVWVLWGKEGTQGRRLCTVITRLPWWRNRRMGTRKRIRGWKMKRLRLWSSVIFLMGNGLRMILILSMNQVLAIWSMNSSVAYKMEEQIKTIRNISGSQRDAASQGKRTWWTSVVLEPVCFDKTCVYLH